MFSLCRLCAKYTEPAELIAEKVELERKLALCCGWQPSPNEFQMPKKVCNACVSEVDRSWNLVEQIRGAETQLNKLLSEQLQSNSNQNDGQQNVDFKREHDVEQINYTFDGKFYEDGNYFNDDGGGDDDDDDHSDTCGHVEVFGESINYSNDKNSEPKKKKKSNEPVKKKTNKNHLQNRKKNDPFFATLNPEDFLDNGQISTDGVTKLTKLYPAMKTMSWNECQYICTKCDQTLKGANNLYIHMRSIHSEDPKKFIKMACFYCSFKTRREAALNRHISAEHYEHLKFR